VSHASMNSKKKAHSVGQIRRVAQEKTLDGDDGGPRRTNGPEGLRKNREKGATEQGVLADTDGEGGAGKKALLNARAAEKTEERGAPPALPTPIATFNI
jgi:hypothetical protein